MFAPVMLEAASNVMLVLYDEEAHACNGTVATGSATDPATPKYISFCRKVVNEIEFYFML